MKKYIVTCLMLLSLCFFPTLVSASSDVYIKDYYIDMTVEESGDLYVKELIILSGDYNGYERILSYQNQSAPKFDGSVESFEGSDIYNASDIELLSIRGVDVPSSYQYDLIETEGRLFEKVASGSDGDTDKYVLTQEAGAYRYRIYQPSYGGLKGFYIEYRIKDVAILHGDVAEVGWNLFSNQQTDEIENLEMKIHLPNNKEELRAWAHGPLNGNVKPVGKNLITVDIQNLSAKVPVDVRFVFDKDSVLYASKTSGTEALPKILKVEQKRADDANKERQKAKIIYYGTIGVSIFWLIGLVVFIVYVYQKYDKEYQSTFKGKYFRDFPSKDTPTTVGYLFHKKIRTDDLSAAILNLVDKKVLSFEEIPNNKKDYILKYSADDQALANVTLSKADEQIISWLFHNTPGSTLKLSDMKTDARVGYEKFYSEYQLWVKCCEEEAEARNFFEPKHGAVTAATVYAIFGFVIGMMTLSMTEDVIFILITIAVFVATFSSLIYFSTFTRRTKEANDLYAKWKGLKNFLNDFGKFATKDLPQVALWNQYLVYAITFGCAEKLIKDMEIKVQELGPTYTGYTPYYNYNYMHSMLYFNRTMNRSVQSAVSSAISTRAAAHSSSSSGSGFGGGFSSGGGSFGGGGGGGHF